MARKEGVFYAEWRRALQEHYLHVIRTDDSVTERTLHGVMLQAGFAEDELLFITDIARCQQLYGVDHPDCLAMYRELYGDDFDLPISPAYEETIDEPQAEVTSETQLSLFDAPPAVTITPKELSKKQANRSENPPPEDVLPTQPSLF